MVRQQRARDWFGHLVDAHFAVQGNMLVGRGDHRRDGRGLPRQRPHGISRSG